MKAQVDSARSSGLELGVPWLAHARVAWLPLAGLLAAAGFVHLISLMRTPAAFVDEAWNASRTWALLNTGQAFGTLDAGVFDRYDGYWTFFPWLGAAVHAPFIYLFGPNLFALRLASLLFGLALLLAVYAIAARIGGRRAGLIAVGLLALSFSFLYSSHLGRHDIIVAAMGYGAIALYLWDEPAKAGFPWKSALSGLLLGLTLDVHLNGLVFGPALLGLFVVDYGWRFIRSGRFWAFAAGGAIAVVYYAAMHILPYPDTYFALASLGNGSRLTPPLMTLDPGLWLRSLAETILGYSLPLGLLAVLAFASLAIRRTPGDRRLLVLASLLVLVFAGVVRNKMFWYAIMVVPAFCLLAAALLEKLTREPWRGSLLAMARTALVVGMVAASFVPSLAALKDDSDADYRAALGLVRQAVPAGASVIGTQTYWFAVPDRRYLSWDQLVYYRRAEPGSTLEDAFRALHPDYFIVDGWLELFITDDAARLAGWRSDTVLSRAELEAFLEKHARLLDSRQTREFGNIQIYRIDWN